MSLLDDHRVREALRLAWLDSRSGTPLAHEEGGFILRSADGSIHVTRWPCGLGDTIDVPAHPGGTFQGMTIVSSFHTHPNVGRDYVQEPSLTDLRAVRDDPDFRGIEYEGEYVISQELIYRILNTGVVEVAGRTEQVLGFRSMQDEEES